MFTESFVRDGEPVLTDSAAIAKNLMFPYWFWGAMIASLSILILYGSLRIVNRDKSIELTAKEA